MSQDLNIGALKSRLQNLDCRGGLGYEAHEVIQDTIKALDSIARAGRARETSCFECGHDLNGPYCPACNPLQAEGAPAAEALTSLIAWHTQERAAWLNVRASNEPGYTERMAKFHSDAIATLRGLHA